MRTQHHLTLSALAAALLLGLTACGSSDNNDPIKSADSTPSHSTKNKHKTTSPSPSNSIPTGKPTFDFPDDFKVKIEENKTGDPTKDEILKDHRYAVLAMNESNAKASPGKNFNRYWKRGANIQFRRVFNAYKKKNASLYGADRYYARKVMNHTAKSARVLMCEDQTKAFDKENKTGKVRRDKPSLDSYRKIRAELMKDSSGDWAVVYYQTLIGDKKCRKEA